MPLQVRFRILIMKFVGVNSSKELKVNLENNNKNNLKDIFYTSLKALNRLTSKWQNLFT